MKEPIFSSSPIKKIGRISLSFLGFTGIVFTLFLGWKGYFTTILTQNVLVDGFGRELYPTPLFLQTFTRMDRMYPGPKWFVLDLIIFGGLIGVSALALYFAEKLKQKPDLDV